MAQHSFDKDAASAWCCRLDDGRYEYGITLFNRANRRRDKDVVCGTAHDSIAASALSHAAREAYLRGEAVI